MRRHAIFLNGPIGAGKTSLGRALAAELGGQFIDGDDYSDPDRPWYCLSLRTSRTVLRVGLDLLEDDKLLIVAYPLRCANWIFYKRRFEDAGVRTLFVTLRASLDQIVAPGRGRSFSEHEVDRIKTMILEGYADRPFADIIVDTGGQTFEAALQDLASTMVRATAGT